MASSRPLAESSPHGSSDCVLLLDRERVAHIKRAVPKDLGVSQVSNSRDLAMILAANVTSFLVLDPALVPSDMMDVIAAAGDLRVVVDVATTAVGLAALWQLLRAIPASIILREHDGPSRIATAFGPSDRAGDLLLRGWAPILSRLPCELSRAIASVTLGTSAAESVDALANLAGRSRRWTELRLHDAGVRSAWRIVVGSRIARAHSDLLDPVQRPADIATRHHFGSVRTLRSQIKCMVGVESETLRRGMGARELALRIASRSVD